MDKSLNKKVTIYEYRPKEINHTKEVFYKCGCKVKLGRWLESHAEIYCPGHGERIVKIIKRFDEW